MRRNFSSASSWSVILPDSPSAPNVLLPRDLLLAMSMISGVGISTLAGTTVNRAWISHTLRYHLPGHILILVRHRQASTWLWLDWVSSDSVQVTVLLSGDIYHSLL